MLLNDILDVSKIEAEALVLENIPYNIKATIYQTADLFRVQADEKHIQLIVTTDPLFPDYVLGDPGRVRQIITNLISNAVKFTNAGKVTLFTSLQKDQLCIKVQDTGTGIPANKIEHIFEKFTQGDSTITRKYGGTGLGLTITKQLVTLMNGSISVASQENIGSVFTVYIPCIIASPNDVSRQDELSQCPTVSEKLLPIAEASVLLVEDYLTNQVFAEKLLKKLGFRSIEIAENGIEAIQYYQRNHYDMILMDCHMPELDGYQTTLRIRGLERVNGKHIPIIAMTANAMMGDREKCLKVGMDHYLSKPLRVPELKKILQTLFLFPQMNRNRTTDGIFDAPETD